MKRSMNLKTVRMYWLLEHSYCADGWEQDIADPEISFVL